MIRLLRSSGLLLCMGLLAILPAFAQTVPTPGAMPPPQGGPGGQRTPPKPRNLKVLPEDTDLRKVMHQYEADLGVQCTFCHAVDPATHRPDFASDANPTKETARAMIRMTQDLNTKYLAQLPNKHDEDAVISCGTCHRGEMHPPMFVPPQQGERPAGMAPGGAPPAAPAVASPSH